MSKLNNLSSCIARVPTYVDASAELRIRDVRCVHVTDPKARHARGGGGGLRTRLSPPGASLLAGAAREVNFLARWVLRRPHCALRHP